MVDKMLFIGVSTSKSSALRLFPKWADALGIDATLIGVDIRVNAARQKYREVLASLVSNEAELGALVTTHKVSIFEGCEDLIAELTPEAKLLGEVGVLYKDGDEQLCADANDYFSTYQASRALLSASTGWQSGCKEALIIGGGGAATALAHTLATRPDLGCTAVRVLEVDAERAQLLRQKVERWESLIRIDVIECNGVADSAVNSLGNGSMIVNATGLGKDRKGSPLANDVTFPNDSIVWDFNYRYIAQPSPTFLEQASLQRDERNLTIADGWHYFLWGWTLAISRVFSLSNTSATFDVIAACPSSLHGSGQNT